MAAGAGVVMIATSGFEFKGINTPSLGAPPLLNQEGNYPVVSIVAVRGLEFFKVVSANYGRRLR